MTKHLFGTLICCALAASTEAQITITASDMPVGPSIGASYGDTLRYSIASPTGLTINLADSGTAKVWDFSSLMPIAQGVDTYKSAANVNISYAVTISPSAYGIKIADSLPGLPIQVKEVYNFYNKKSSPSRFVVEGFAAKISGLPIPVNYTSEDVIYNFPLSYPHGTDVSNFKLSYSMAGLGGFAQAGTRTTRVDGWGTITTPYANAVSVIRVRSEIVEVDSVTVGGTSMGIPRHVVEYKWLANGEHYPLLYVVANKIGGTEVPTLIRYRDTKRSTLNVPAVAKVQTLEVYPNPAFSDKLNLVIPAAWLHFSVRVYDMEGRVVASSNSQQTISIGGLKAGHYLLVAECGNSRGYAQFVKK
ncbi:MAG: T9SS type A sorting domain-containing protein [Bacteroidetes bacterium]|nr:T9SS type A sorting domain-containing protein [Bacteroidota bacterium]